MCSEYHYDNEGVTYGFISQQIASIYKKYTKGNGKIKLPKERFKYLVEEKVISEKLLILIDKAIELYDEEDVNDYLKTIDEIENQINNLEMEG